MVFPRQMPQFTWILGPKHQ